MEIEIVTAKKKLTKSMIKQFEPADWKYINFYFVHNPLSYKGKLFFVRGVFKCPVIIFKGGDSLWRYFPMHKYTLKPNGEDVYVNNSRHLFINDKKQALEFIDNIATINRFGIKIII